MGNSWGQLTGRQFAEGTMAAADSSEQTKQIAALAAAVSEMTGHVKAQDRKLAAQPKIIADLKDRYDVAASRSKRDRDMKPEKKSTQPEEGQARHRRSSDAGTGRGRGRQLGAAPELCYGGAHRRTRLEGSCCGSRPRYRNALAQRESTVGCVRCGNK